jgi:YD repeat-containing protein
MNLIAQSNFVLGNQVEQPSTDVWNFIKYGEITPSLYTGTVNVSVPFYTYKDNDFEIPISFDYASNGFIPNTPPGTLGMDWRLNVGGSIAVEIKGHDDFAYPLDGLNKGITVLKNFNELTQNNYRKTSRALLIDGRFYYFKFIPFPTENGCPWRFKPSFPRPNIYYCPDYEDCSPYDQDCCRTVYDAEPDIYHFNFMGYAGTFHRDYDGSVHVYNTNTNNKDFKIEITGYSNTDSYIKITTADGYQYLFEPKEYTKRVGQAENASVYKLTKITAPNGRWVSFVYQGYYNTPNVNPGFLQAQGEYADCLLCNNPDLLQRFMYADFLKYSETKITVLSHIITSERNEILFKYETIPFGYYSDSIKRLTDIIVSNRMDEIKKCSLEYKQNPYGTKYSYLASIDILGEGKYLMDYHGWNSHFPQKDTYGLDHWGYYNGQQDNDASVFLYSSKIQNNYDEIITTSKRNPNHSRSEYGVLSKITYPTGGYSTFEYEAHNFSKAVKRMSINNFIPELRDSTGYCGGVRIKSIKNYLSNNNLANYKEFEYIVRESKVIYPIQPPPGLIADTGYQQITNTKLDTVEIIKSSGILLNVPRYRIRYTAVYQDQSSPIIEKDMEFYSSNVLTYGKTNIEYNKVIEKRNDGSKIEYNYTNYSMSKYHDNWVWGFEFEDTTTIGANILINQEGFSHYKWGVVPNSKNLVHPGKSLQAERGKLYKKDIFNADSVPKLLYSEINSYDSIKNLATDALPAYFVKEVALVPVNIENYDLLSTSKIQYLDSIAVGENTSYTYNAHGQIASQTTVDSKGDITITEFKYVTDMEQDNNSDFKSSDGEEQSAIYADMLDNNVLNYPLSEKIYKIKYGSNIKTLIDGRIYTYTQPTLSKHGLVRIGQIKIFDHVKNSWIVDKKYKYDRFGNLLEREDRNGIKTSYIWGYDGLHLVAICENTSIDDVISIFNNLLYPLSGGLTEQKYSALKSISPTVNITKFDYEPLVGLTRITDHSGKVTEYDYNNTGKLQSVIDDKSDLRKKYYYSTDN